MVLLKSLDYGFNGYRVPPTPRAARSARRRCEFRRNDYVQKMCAFDLLATVAGKLLLEGDCSSKSVDTSSDKEQPEVVEGSDKKGEYDENKPLEEKSCEQDSCERNFLFTEIVSQASNSNFHANEFGHCQNDACSRPASVITSESSEKVRSAEPMLNDDCKLRLGIFPHPVDVESSVCRLEGETKKQIKIESSNNRNLAINNWADTCSVRDSEAWNRKPSALVSSADSQKFPVCSKQILCGSFPIKQDVVKLVTTDDDEKTSGCTRPSTANKAFRPPPPLLGDCKTRKLLTSKYWKPTPNSKDYDSHAERYNYLNMNKSYKRQRSQRDYPFKKRNFFYCSSVSNSDEGIGSDGICSVPENGSAGSALGSGPSLPIVSTPPTSLRGERASFQSRNSHVKLKIKSFRVPELFIEVPESATVGSLKRTVMEAMTEILGGGLRVGVLLQGKKIRDDKKTLLQTGISHDNKKLDSLGFTLEPSRTQPPLCLEDHSFERPCDTPQPLASPPEVSKLATSVSCLADDSLLCFATRYPPMPNVGQIAHPQGNLDTLSNPTGTKVYNFIESDRDSAPFPPSMSLEKTTTDSKALVSVPPMKAEELAIVPMRKSKHSESAQRRIRRPFTVSEVEALVQAVEKLGTGRWRDVKLRAFDNAKHRTYVDLKDKWKTLVHTARISPQQRRGEPVPQELLDRVLTAHAFWSQQQAKQQLKPQPQTCLLL
ncbi:telomere repeat-binding protein 1-like isoform X2 [Olea europaea var. sylvestris]|uniref:telomere repeat-binding protein 1-like isoform X2 n=1 Tax=Olea europaea var. sylvestris TaxID=158386 RepID=UPI000C1CF8F7|nr:telomere repeat-binding protein 1-like isoform X2 [Olea europaea var. sylvestris]